MHTELLGYVAAGLTTFSFVPQAWQTWKTRNTEGISLVMYSAFAVGVALWLIYGLMIAAWPMVAANVVTLTLALFILGLKLRHR
jgi:MtN3 and saliva related transmembrane protein